MQIPFAAYAEDCTVTGEIALEADRLSDLLASQTEFEVGGAAFRALDDGRVVETESAAVLREDLCVVTASGPRGRSDRRLWTRQYPVRARVGPYTVLGYIHAPPTIDPMRTTDRRPIVAMTSSIIEFTQAGVWTRVEADALLLNSAKIAVLETASEEDLGMSREVAIPVEVDPRAKDMTEGDQSI